MNTKANSGAENSKPAESKIPRKVIITILVALAIIVLIIILCMPSSNDGGTKNGRALTSVESSAIASARLGAANSALDSSGEINKSTCESLSNMATTLGGDWFDSCDYSLLMKLKDTKNYYVLTISDGDYCATIKTDTELDNLIEYSFEDGGCEGYRVSIGD